jgi:hypothetical protein
MFMLFLSLCLQNCLVVEAETEAQILERGEPRRCRFLPIANELTQHGFAASSRIWAEALRQIGEAEQA